MMYEKFSAPQKSAVDAGGNTIVSAAAGSGKTAVLVERIIHSLTRENNPISADKLLAITFTVAAAGEMRSRLENGLEEYCRLHPDDISATRQRMLLQSAKIGTIDSFCIGLVRENFDSLSVSPDFKIADDSDIGRIYKAALDTVFENCFALEDAEFHTLLDLFGSTIDDANLRNAVESVYKYSLTMPFKKQWFDSARKMQSVEQLAVWKDKLFSYVKEQIDSLLYKTEKGLALCSTEDKLVTNYLPGMEAVYEHLLLLKAAAENKEWDRLYNLIRQDSGAKLKSISNPPYPEKTEALKALKAKIKATVEKKLAKLIEQPEDETDRLYLQIAPSTVKLIDLAEQLDIEIQKELKKADMLTFSDVEHLALSLLCSLDADGNIVVTKKAEELQNSFDEVLVDEYQDVNDLQNTLFLILSANGKKRFVVGDIKQSIYGFRGANPDNFAYAVKNAVAADEHNLADNSVSKNIVLGENYRSRPDVCHFANFVFSRFMSEKTCSLDYGEGERLVPKALYPEQSAPAVEARFVNSDGNDTQTEATAIADYIEAYMLSGKTINEKGVLREPRYSDFAVIMRDASACLLPVAEALKARGIPVSYEKDDFLSCLEIKTVLDLLTVISNPTKDVELLSVLLSPMFCFTADNVANLRAGHTREPLYSSVIRAAQNGDIKAAEFIGKLDAYRRYAVLYPITVLIGKLYNDTDYLNIVSSMSEGGGRRANLMLLLEHAATYEASGRQDIDGFLYNLSTMSDKLNKAAAINGGSNSVKLMTIHKSKGLQFPVCILAFATRAFSNNEEKSSLLIDREGGVTMRYYDSENGRVTPLQFCVGLQEVRRRKLSEELRVLYVALTRACDKLVIFFTGSKMEQKLSEQAAKLYTGMYDFSYYDYLDATGYSSWLIPAVLSHSDSIPLDAYTGVEFIRETAIGRISATLTEPRTSPVISENEMFEEVDSELLDKLKENLNSKYKYAPLMQIESKSSVSAMLNKAESFDYDYKEKPGFMTEKGLSATARGTAVHKVMQFMDFKSAMVDLQAEIDRLYEWQYITEAEYNAVDTEHIKRFIQSELFSRIVSSVRVEREMKFLTDFKAGSLHTELPLELKNEKIIVQGAVDCAFLENDGVVVVDFKTDRVPDTKKLVEAYSEQLNIYSLTCEKIFGIPVKEKIIYSLYLDCEVKL